MPSEIKKRIEWVDTSKGIAIILVIAGHIFNGNIKYIIFTFHMPFFFILSGYLQRQNSKLDINKYKNIVFQYFVYWVALTLADFIINHDEISWKYIIRSIYNFIMGGVWLTGDLGVFWFVPVFIISNIILKLSSNLKVYQLLTLDVTLLLMSYLQSTYLNVKIPYDLNVCLYASSLMITGNILRRCNFMFNWWAITPCMIISCISIILYHKAFNIDLKASKYGIIIISQFVCISATIFIIQISKSIKNNAILILGVNSLTVMFIHQFIHFNISDKITNSDTLRFLSTLAICYAYVILSKKIKIKRNRKKHEIVIQH